MVIAVAQARATKAGCFDFHNGVGSPEGLLRAAVGRADACARPLQFPTGW